MVLPAGFITFSSFAGYLYGAHDLTAVGDFESMVPNTTVTFAAFCLGLLSSSPDAGLLGRCASGD